VEFVIIFKIRKGIGMSRKNYLALGILVAMCLTALTLQMGCHSRSGKVGCPYSNKDIVDTAVSAGDFKTLVTAIQAAGLVETLKSPGPFTVFAPTDEAFAKLPPGTVEDLLKPENKAKLASILTYHVVSGKVMAADVVKLTEAKTVNGQTLTIKVEGGVVMVDGAKVTKTDIKCSNGVIHVIDTVMLPK
jgi:transforming growth factor-beta-induced protein